ncbi:hypothetical protein PENSTE_c028G06253 [Penicillium steckii]|uniref:Uncharacterized protein n=1 Tax=Penicillium steckii TaxID=303698 RepID=A0A1V6SNS9_9EURO|nr:hypothetical protein PENSTE_c028G06253 [Penicillium steckii]
MLSKAGNPSNEYQYVIASVVLHGHIHKLELGPLCSSIGTRQTQVNATAAKTTACSLNPETLNAVFSGDLKPVLRLILFVSFNCEKTPYVSNMVTNGFRRLMEKKNTKAVMGSM